MSVLIENSKCISCGKCVNVCPGDLLAFDSSTKASMKDPQDCWDCMACVKICPEGAITTKLPYQLADYKATLRSTVYSDRIVWVCTDIDGNEEEFVIKTLDF